MLLTRTATRLLSDGKEITFRRSYRIRFVPTDGGYRVDGELVNVDVTCPPGLEAFAALERARPDSGVFPIELDRQGRISPGGERAPSGGTTAAARLAQDRIAASTLRQDERTAAVAIVQQIADQKTVTLWPLDLFHPEEGHRTSVQQLQLPTGEHGEVRIATEAATRGPQGLVGSYTRTIQTSIGASIRETRESWTLVDATASAY